MYGLGVFVFVKSFSVGGTDDSNSANIVLSTISRFGSMVNSAGSSFTAASGIYQIIVSTICALALLWFFRQLLSGEKTSAKQSFYQGMRPLVPYLLVLMMLGIYLIPVALGGYLLSLLLSSYILFGWEMYMAWAIFGLLAFWSLRLMTHGIFGLIAVTLPDMTPLRALRGAKKMVYRRRLTIWRKLFLATVLVAVCGFIVVAPFVALWPAFAPWVFFSYTVIVTTFGQAFLYTIYREIL